MHEHDIYLNDWSGSGKDRLKKAFGIGDRELEGVEILLASYTRDDFHGEAFVLFRRQGVLFEVNASHNSSDGLEGQWEPEDTLIEALRYRLEKGCLGSPDGGINLFADELLFLLTELEFEC